MCGDADKDDRIRVYIDCMERIRGDFVSPPDCRRRAGEICYALSGKLPFLTRTRLAFANAKGIASDFASLVGIVFEPWNHADCIAVHQDDALASAGASSFWGGAAG